uniref:Ras-related protein Rab-36 n=1 Tax=Strigamia maritima TaxID=126957 RepID=T1ITZ7_STRMM
MRDTKIKNTVIYIMRFETPCQKLLRMNAAPDRVLSTVCPSFVASPYNQVDFDERVKDICLSNKNVSIGLKICKAIIVGNVSVGKTSLVNRFCHQTFEKDYKATIGVDFEVERFDILQVPFNLQIWDTAGQERFKCIASSYYRGAQIVIIVFDLSDLETLFNCPQWFEDAMRGNNSNPHLFLVGTKKDLISDFAYKIMEKNALEFAEEINAEYWPVSSKTGENVQSFFNRVAALSFNASVLREFENSENPIKMGSSLLHLNPNSQDLIERKKESKCCSIQ